MPALQHRCCLFIIIIIPSSHSINAIGPAAASYGALVELKPACVQNCRGSGPV
jgi:hypothetical protein